MTRFTAIHASKPKAAKSAGPSISQNVRGEPLIDFHVFADLAAEIQDAIWEFSCYSAPEINPIFINDKTFKFQIKGVPAVPAVLHATSAARAIGLCHFLLVKFDELSRNPPRPPPQHQFQVAQGLQQLFQQHQAQLAQNQLALQNTNQGPGVQAYGLSNALLGNPQPALLAPAPPAQGPSNWQMVTYNPQTAHQAQHNFNNLGLVYQQGQQTQSLYPSWFQNHAVQPFANVGGSQQTVGQGLGLQHNFQQGFSHQTQGSFGGSGSSYATLASTHSFSQNMTHYQSTFGGSQQNTAIGGPSGTHNGAHYHSPYGGSMQSNAVGQHNAAHQGSQQQNIFGGNFQPASVGHHNVAQGSQHQSAFGGSFQPAPASHHNAAQGNQQNVVGGSLQPASIGQQPISQISSLSHGAGLTLVIHPSPAYHAGFAAPANTMNALVPVTTTNTAVSHNPLPQQRLITVDDETDDDFDRYFYVNPGRDIFKLQVGAPTGYNYPTYSLTCFPNTLTPISDEGRQAYMQRMQQAYTLPTPFPAPGRLPGFLARIKHLVINLELAPCNAPMRSAGFWTWLHGQTKKFCEVIIKSTIKRFQGVRHLDLLIDRASHSRPIHAYDQMVLRNFRQAPIQEEDGITFGHAELGLIEREIRVWMMSEYMGKNGPEGPDIRIVVYMPKRYS
ncbi:hypothetical protein V8E51_000657 [Hyaloscypha variabilis]